MKYAGNEQQKPGTKKLQSQKQRKKSNTIQQAHRFQFVHTNLSLVPRRSGISTETETFSCFALWPKCKINVA